MDTAELKNKARRHLGPHFTRGDQWRGGDMPVFVRGEGCHLFDSDGHRFLDGLSGLFCVNLGHSRSDIVSAATKQMDLLPYSTNWGSAHPPAIETASLIAELAPGDLNTTFFVNSGSEAVESALKFVRQYHHSRGQPERTKIISREMAYHGTTMGALSVTGIPKIRQPFEPLLNTVRHIPNTLGVSGDCGPASQLDCIRRIEQVIAEEGPESIAAIFAEPVQNGRGALVPPDGYWQQLRRICDEHGILLVSDEVICSFGRLGSWFGSARYGATPDLVTFAKGSTSGYAPLGGVVVREPLVEQLFDAGSRGGFTHGATWGGHPAATAVAAATINAMREESVLANVESRTTHLRSGLDDLQRTHRCVKEVRGTGFFYAIELMADRGTGRELTDEQSRRVLREVLPQAFQRTGVVLRGDDRGATMLMVSPPLIADNDVLNALLRGIDGMLTDMEHAIPA